MYPSGQICKNVDSVLSKYQTDFQKGYSSQHSLNVMFEKLRKHLDRGVNVVHCP